jgi:hypothetical protein
MARAARAPVCRRWGHESTGGGRSLSTRAVACNVALVRAVGQLFGGAVELNDATGTEETYVGPGFSLWAEDGPDWYRKQALLAAIKPLTTEDFDAVREHAAY